MKILYSREERESAPFDRPIVWIWHDSGYRGGNLTLMAGSPVNTLSRVWFSATLAEPASKNALLGAHVGWRCF